MTTLAAVLIGWTLWASPDLGQTWQPVQDFQDRDRCIIASYRVGFRTGALAECRPMYRF